MAVTKERVTDAAVVCYGAGRHGGGSGCQLVYKGGVVRYVSRGPQAVSSFLWLLPPHTEGADPEVCFLTMPRV